MQLPISRIHPSGAASVGPQGAPAEPTDEVLVDRARAGDTAAFSLVTSAGCPGTDNGSFAVAGTSLTTAASFDFEAKASYAICVRATDGGSLTLDEPFTIAVGLRTAGSSLPKMVMSAGRLSPVCGGALGASSTLCASTGAAARISTRAARGARRRRCRSAFTVKIRCIPYASRSMAGDLNAILYRPG